MKVSVILSLASIAVWAVAAVDGHSGEGLWHLRHGRDGDRGRGGPERRNERLLAKGQTLQSKNAKAKKKASSQAPSSGSCPDGSEPVNCQVTPCAYTTCIVGTRCVANYCGGCNAECVDDSDGSGSDNLFEHCGSTTDCIEGKEYCTQEGNCMPYSKCDVDDDCRNPDNDYSYIQCVGTLSCKNNQCHVECQ